MEKPKRRFPAFIASSLVRCLGATAQALRARHDKASKASNTYAISRKGIPDYGWQNNVLARQRVPSMASAASAIRISSDRWRRSEEHTSELQSLMRISYAGFCLKQKNTNINNNTQLIHPQEHTY